MWRGPVWVNINYFFIEALRADGSSMSWRSTLRDKTLDLIMGNRRDVRILQRRHWGASRTLRLRSLAGPLPCLSTWRFSASRRESTGGSAGRPPGRENPTRRLVKQLQAEFFADRALIIAANRGPVTFQSGREAAVRFTRGTWRSGDGADGLWAATPMPPGSPALGAKRMLIGNRAVARLTTAKPATLRVYFLSPDPTAYDGYYNIIANPLLWFLQHSHVGSTARAGDRSQDLAGMGRGLCRGQPVVCGCDSTSRCGPTTSRRWSCCRIITST